MSSGGNMPLPLSGAHEEKSMSTLPSTNLMRFGLLSIAASIVTFGIKYGAYVVSDSVGLLSDALESLVNLAASVFATLSLIIAARPPDACHPHGHGKIEFFSAGAEGALIILAAGSIAWAAVGRLLHPVELLQLDLGLALSLVAGLINLAVAQILLRAGRQHDSIILEADGRHLMTDVWTSVGLLVALGIVAIGPSWMVVADPIIAIIMAINIAYTGYGLVRTSVDNLMDRALPAEELERIHAILNARAPSTATYHALKTRKSGRYRFIEFHLLVDGDISVRHGHDVATDIEHALKVEFPGAEVLIHIEPLDSDRTT